MQRVVLMKSDHPPSENKNRLQNESDFSWPETPSAILIMGKRQGTKKENKQLWGRVAMAVALWYSAPEPKPYLLFVASDIHSPSKTPDAMLVKSILLKQFGIPADYLILRQVSNCTLLEVRTVRVLKRIYRLSHIFATTHLYHAARAQRYFNEVLPDASVIPVHPAILDEISFPANYPELLNELRSMIEDSLPGRFDSIREYVIEWFLNQAHTLDQRGRFERRLARFLRPRSYRA